MSDNNNNAPVVRKSQPQPQQDFNPAPNLQLADITVLDDELNGYRQMYCEHSGKPCGKVDAQQVEDLVTIHGRHTAIELLKLNQRQVSLEWIWLNSEGLDSLAFHRPREYFVYAASKLLQDLTLHNELMRLHEAAQAWNKLQQIPETVLHPINELVRRLLSRYKQQSLVKKLRKIKYKRIDLIATSVQTLGLFQAELQAVLNSIVEKEKATERYEKGLSAFRMQKMIQGLSELEISVGKELNDFELIDDKSISRTEMTVGQKYRTLEKKQKYSSKTIKSVGLVQLKFGGNDNV